MGIKGFDKLQRELSDAQKAMSELDGDICTVSFNPDDPSSIEAAIQHVMSTIDTKIGRYASNPFVAPLVEASKEAYREAILEKASAARLKDSSDE